MCRVYCGSPVDKWQVRHIVRTANAACSIVDEDKFINTLHTGTESLDHVTRDRFGCRRLTTGTGTDTGIETHRHRNLINAVGPQPPPPLRHGGEHVT